MRLERSQIVAGVAFSLVLLMPILGAGYLINKYQWAQARLAELEPRYSRLLGLEASQEPLKQAVAAAAAFVARNTYPSSLDVSQAGNEAQQRIRGIVTGAGLSLLSSQVLPPKNEALFERVPLAVRLEGELPALQAALILLVSQQPAIHFENMSVQTMGVVKAETPQRLAVQLNVYVLRVKK